MRSLNLANSKKRDAEVGLQPAGVRPRVQYLLADGTEKKNVRLLKNSIELSEDELVEKYKGDWEALGKAIIDGDPEIDMESTGRVVKSTRKLYLDNDNNVVYHVNLYQVRKNPAGEEISRQDLMKSVSNVNQEIPIQWTGKKFPKKQAIKKFVVSRKYQIKHISGLTYDFLYEMAKDLAETDSLMLVGAGSKAEPLIMSTGGDPYRGFLEGRIDGDKYCLILHLTNMELKGVENEII
jgi:hypothetical protein